ncbi:MAG: UvrD-helicase domain-containing protein, partial [Burkholderiales bacterium]
REAARETILHLQAGTNWSKAVEILLEHLDNDWPKLEALLVPMLARRHQWLRGVPGKADRARCEQALANVIEEAVAAAHAACPEQMTGEVVALARYAAQQLEEADRESAIRDCRSLVTLREADLAAWLGMARLLLKTEGSWRVPGGVNVKIGFPSGNGASKKHCEEMKARMCALLDALRPFEEFRECLHALRKLPSTSYSDEQWKVLEALLEALRLAAGELQLVFKQRGQIDFSGIEQAALSALGGESEPTDLTLALDSRISHLLVDEFQDTSVSQFELIARLTAGWQKGDGRTLFLVGDPMQSIYAFRRAEVGLFLTARHSGIGGVKLDPLILTVNFRSHSGLVDWVNATFARVLPPHEDIGEGAVPFSPAVANVPAPANFEVEVHPYFGDDWLSEAKQVAAIAAAARDAGQTAAVLVRNKNHLELIAPQLAAAGLRFKAVDIETLRETQVVRDLTSLTRAYLYLADRIAWFAVLRAPWCGLTLADLEVLAQGERTIWDNMLDNEVVARLSTEGRSRLKRVMQVFEIAFAERGKAGLRGAIEGIWLALGGPACARDETALANADLYFAQVPEAEEDFDSLDDAELFAAPDASAGNDLQLLTVHKAKGLEFDVVILPGLGRIAGKDDPALLRWAQRAGAHGVDLLLAPIPATPGKGEAIYDYLREREKRRERLEEGRLLYVAATRAKHRLHLLGHVNVASDSRKEPAPVSSSPLAILWHALGHKFARDFARPSAAKPKVSQPPLYRLPLSWTLPAPPANVSVMGVPAAASENALDYFWVTDITRHIGNVVHQTLARIGSDGIERWPAARIAAMRKRHAQALAQLGVPGTELDRAASEVERALVQTLSEARGRWIFDLRHKVDKSEYALTGIDSGQIVNVVLDRTFVDEKGTRWIIDFKT